MEKKEKKGSIFDSTIEAFQSFLRVPNTVTKRGSHVRDCNDLKRVMIIVVVALIPTLLFGIYNIGDQHSIAAGIDMGFWQKVWASSSHRLRSADMRSMRDTSLPV